MCLTIDRTYHPHKKALIAQEDILVYKSLIGRDKHLFISPYRGTYWHINKLVSMKSTFSFIGDSVYRGIHAYTHFCYNWTLKRHYTIIPKGTMFYIGTCDDVVAHELIVFETIKDYSNYKASKNCKTITIGSYIKKYLAG